jgi:hypothetical protein
LHVVLVNPKYIISTKIKSLQRRFKRQRYNKSPRPSVYSVGKAAACVWATVNICFVTVNCCSMNSTSFENVERINQNIRIETGTLFQKNSANYVHVLVLR